MFGLTDVNWMKNSMQVLNWNNIKIYTLASVIRELFKKNSKKINLFLVGSSNLSFKTIRRNIPKFHQKQHKGNMLGQT